MVDAVLYLPDFGTHKSWIIFSGTKWARHEWHDHSNGLVDGPLDIRDKWQVFQDAEWGTVDAIVPVPNNPHEFYAFHGSHYFRGKFDPKDLKTSFVYTVGSIKGAWGPLWDAGFDRIDAAVVDPADTNYIYFFRGTKYVRYNWDKNTAGHVNTITDYWASIKDAGWDYIDAIFTTEDNGKGKYYAYSGDQYIDIEWSGYSDKKTDGPNLINHGWKDVSWLKFK